MASLQDKPEEYDLLILGSGAGSKLLAWTFAGRGQRVAVVERKYVGGSCPNIACLPSKNIIHTAQFAHNVRRSKEFGISVDGFQVNMSAVRERKRRDGPGACRYTSRSLQTKWSGVDHGDGEIRWAKDD